MKIKNMTKTITVCIPAYNRANVLAPLLDSIVNQEYHNYSILICEDKSPERDTIRSIVGGYQAKYPCIINYIENDVNLGYDANIRKLIECADGDFCFFMGNDDLMCPGALSIVAGAIERHDNIGVVLRSYASFDDSPENINQLFKYFDKELFFPAGPSTITTFFRRSVVIPGVTFHRKEALKYSTDRCDGTLLYQLYIIANILTTMNGVFLPDIIVLYRNGGIPEFGSSEKEKGIFVPKDRTMESSLHFMQGMLDIAKLVEKDRGVKIFKPILRDLGNYSYGFLFVQANKGIKLFVTYVYRLAKMGFWNNKWLYAYSFLLILFGTTRVDKLIQFIKKRLGYTPAIGSIYRGDSA
jgi:glycosyltransferase involved in cell wall biosynthesis